MAFDVCPVVEVKLLREYNRVTWVENVAGRKDKGVRAVLFEHLDISQVPRTDVIAQVGPAGARETDVNLLEGAVMDVVIRVARKGGGIADLPHIVGVIIIPRRPVGLEFLQSVGQVAIENAGH